LATWRERDHPRDQRGRFTDSPGGWADRVSARLDRRGTDDRDPVGVLLAAISRGPSRRSTSLSGGRVATVELQEFDDPDTGEALQVVRKTSSDPLDAEGEILASQIGRAIGAPVLPVIRDPRIPTAVYMPYVENARSASEVLDDAVVAKIEPGVSPMEWDYIYADLLHDLKDQHNKTTDGLLLGLLDLLLGNHDRHPGNWLIREDGRVWGIDHAGRWMDILNPLTVHDRTDGDPIYDWHPYYGDFTGPILDAGHVDMLDPQALEQAGRGLSRLFDRGEIAPHVERRLRARWLGITGEELP
jgi:hypothetical protein